MSRNFQRSTIVIALLLAVLLQAPSSSACGPFALEAIFSFSVHPEYPLEKYAAGDLGIVPPTYARSYLVVAYRYLNGDGFSQAEREALVELWHDRLDLRWEAGDEQAVKTWLDARQKIDGVGEAPKIEVFRNREKPNEYESYLNCQNDSFETAATTLEARIGRFGADKAALKDWVAAQDQVFANCSEGQHIPAALAADTDALLQADRQYQTAAANFYSGNFAAAQTLFESIAADAKSPWRANAPYLVARTILRKASLGPDETKKGTLAEAEQKLNDVLTNKELKASHAAAKRLLSIVRLRLHPEDRLHELAVSLASKSGTANLKQDLWDYTVLLDQSEGAGDRHHQKPTVPSPSSDDDLTDWILNYQSDKADAGDHALARWEATASTPWLIAALSKIDPKNPKAVLLQQAAAKIPPSSPAFQSASFQSIRLDVGAGRAANARTKLDDLLTKHRSTLNTSSLNLLLEQRMLVASNLDELLTYAQRRPAGYSWNEDGRQLPADKEEIGSEADALLGKTRFDFDGGEILNRRLPLSLLSEAAANKRLPDDLRRDLTQAAWLRAVLVGNHATATALVPELKTMVPELAPLLNEYTGTSEPAAKTFSALYAWLKFPGIEPIVDTGSGRGAPLNEQESYRDNWWCSAANSTPATELKRPQPSFLTAAQKAAANREYATLTSFGAAPNYLCREVIAWATNHPSDPRVPEALHLAVKSTRYGCTDKQTGKWSKAAYDLLHRRYPGNTWTRQTPYWFKD
ncbi:MAG TPA: hypothetical protein VGO56_20370 [Pyrinomonadaceae bacterium]|jgi:hypothetical protein|nr:hypothetical protein [Pyrinomonadaceae bacterium]